MRRKSILWVFMAVSMTAAMTMTVYAAEWKQEGSTWKYQNDNGSFAVGWNWIGGKCYYFDISGNMLSNTTTPDGYQVNENGEWVVDGVVQSQSGQNINTSGRQFGSSLDSSMKGYWSDKNNLTWTWWIGREGDRNIDGESVVIGRGPKYSDIHPEITDPEHILNDSVYYLNGAEYMNPHDPDVWSSTGQQKMPIYHEQELELLREFVNSFNWINSDELTRAQAVYNRVANGHSGNYYDTPQGDPYCRFSVLENKVGVCENFSNEFSWLASYVGLECVTYQPSIRHQACLLKINGQWLAVDPTGGLPFINNNDTVPVDFDVEYHRVENEFKQSDTYEKVQEENKLEEQYWNGEITYEELQKKVADLYK